MHALLYRYVGPFFFGYGIGTAVAQIIRRYHERFTRAWKNARFLWECRKYRRNP